MKQFLSVYRRLRQWLLLGLLITTDLTTPLAAAPSPRLVTGVAGTSPMGQPVPANQAPCFDLNQVDVLLDNVPGSGTVAQNWVTGQRNVVNSRPFTVCGPGGLLFAANSADQTGWRFSTRDPGGR